MENKNWKYLSLPGFVRMEQARGIEPPLSAWQADVLPLNYTCKGLALYIVYEEAIFFNTFRFGKTNFFPSCTLSDRPCDRIYDRGVMLNEP